ncbi:hypothetical protein BSF41_00150 [Flavobacterium sp. ACN2]|uniref:hypothetical protein n=1 Tax=Flavobacterium sp. ACN2 TaxID=1975676 RepID=UPI000BB2E684|nr:hypothetical protein [Flavobacterium sp. ACN2]PBI94266.1 hypothetical protein BSF41_00150 [Flavobacterium sp. ACN2]
MKKLVLISLVFAYGCNMSDQNFELPCNYIFVKEGGHSNIVLQKNKLIIDKGAVDFSFDDKFIFFSVDNNSSMEPYKVPKEKLTYYIHDINKDTLSKPLNYNFIRKFMIKNSVKKQNNILVK